MTLKLDNLDQHKSYYIQFKLIDKNRASSECATNLHTLGACEATRPPV